MVTERVFPYSRKYFELPEPYENNYYDPETQRGPRDIPVMFLTRMSKEQRDNVMTALGSGNVPDHVAARPLDPIPWLRSCTPSLSDVLGLINGSAGVHVFIDNEGIEGKTCIVSHWYCPKGLPPGDSGGQEVARISWDDAVSLVSNSSRYQSWFPDRLPENVRIRKEDVLVEEEGFQSQDSSPATQEDKQEWEWPAHIPMDLKLSKDKPTIISMVHLSEPETISFLLEISGPVAIINWPAGIEPASNADIWNIFDRIKPEWPRPIGEIFFFTIDSFHLNGEGKNLEIIMYSRKLIDDRERAEAGSLGFETENKMTSHSIPGSVFYSAWECCFNPSGRGWSSGVRENDKMRDVMSATRQHGFFDQFRHVTNPDVPVVWEELPVFLLTEVTATQERDLIVWLTCDGPLCFVIVPKQYSDGTMKGLMKWFQSPEYMCYQEKPPDDFIAIDSITLAALPSFLSNSEDAEDPSFLAATGAYVQDFDSVGYIVGRAKLEENLTYWIGFVCQAMGCMLMMSQSATDDQTGAGRFFWECFDTEDEELAGLVTTRE